MQKKKTNYITPAGHQKLVDELNHLVLNERPQITKTIQWAAGNGDRSENADYIYGKRRLREIDKRSNFLRKRIEVSNIINPAHIKSEVIKFGATVLCFNELKNQEISYKIVGVDEVDTELNKISWKSPIGNSLLNKEIGDVITIKTTTNEYEIEILDITYQEIT